VEPKRKAEKRRGEGIWKKELITKIKSWNGIKLFGNHYRKKTKNKKKSLQITICSLSLSS